MSLTRNLMSMFLKRKEISVNRMAQKYIKDDIVMYDNRIHTIIDTLGLNNYELSYVRHPVSQVRLSGVPITPEILEKNGWKSINGKYALKIKIANYVLLEFTEDGIYTYINEKTMLFTIKYIHELQHLLFGLGINHEMEV